MVYISQPYCHIDGSNVSLVTHKKRHTHTSYTWIVNSIFRWSFKELDSKTVLRKMVLKDFRMKCHSFGLLLNSVIQYVMTLW